MKYLKEISREKIFISILCVSLSLLITFLITVTPTERGNAFLWRSQAKEMDTFLTSNHTEDSSIMQVDSVSLIDIRAYDTLFTSSKSGDATAYKVLSALEKVIITEGLSTQSASDGASTIIDKHLLPAGYSKNVKLVRSYSDGKVKYPLLQKNISHYVFQQQMKVNDKKYPILGAITRVDLKNKKDLTDINGVVLRSEKFETGIISKSEMEKAALAIAKKDYKRFSLQICDATKPEIIVVNKNIIGIERDNTNYVTQTVDICSKEKPPAFSRRYYISKKTGKEIFSQMTTFDAVNRKIYDCQNSPTCIGRRFEGETSEYVDVNTVYDAFGETYKMLLEKFTRDSLDGKSLPMVGNVNYSSPICPNASWSTVQFESMFCSGVVSRDLAVHEMIHGLTQFSANLMYEYQSGALNESFSDIFAHYVDRDDWQIGEESLYGVWRNMDKPTDLVTIRLPNGVVFNSRQPDKLFSPYYYTGSDDSGGVHVNSGILNYAYYLMSAGGTFNDVTVIGLGDDIVMPVMFRALTVYLKEMDNFCDGYIAIHKACVDIYGVSSNECKQIVSAMQAVEMDYQPKGTQIRPATKGTAPVCQLEISIPPTATPPVTPQDQEYCSPKEPGLLNNAKEETKESEWLKRHKYGDCKDHNSGLWPEQSIDCLISDEGDGPNNEDQKDYKDPENLYYKHFTPIDGLSLINPATLAELVIKFKDPSQQTSAKVILLNAIKEAIARDPQKAVESSFDSLYLGIENGKEGNPVRSASLMVHPVIERDIVDKIGSSEERVKKLYQPFIEAFIGKQVDTKDVNDLYMAALNKCGNGALNNDQSGRGLLKDFGDYVGVVQFWTQDKPNDLFSEYRDCNIHLVRKTPCNNGQTPTVTPGATITPKIAQCNQTCISAGFLCATGLTCFTTNTTPGVTGSDKCRNPLCTDKEDCQCDGPTATPIMTIAPTATLAPGEPTATPIMTVAPTATLAPGEPTATPTPEDEEEGTLDLKMWLKFQGILKKPTNPLNIMSVRIGLFSLDMEEPEYKRVEFTADDNGIWSGTVSFDLPTDNYVVYVKGPSHLQKKVGSETPTETYPGTYLSYKNMILLKSGETNLDFSGITQPVGDIAYPAQDGMVNASDIGYVVAHYGETDNILCDVNRDGVCGTQDHALIIEALANRFDQDYY